MQVKSFFDEQTFTLTHIVYDKNTADAVLFDPVLDLDTVAWKTEFTSMAKLDDFIKSNSLKLHYVIDTHVHADHLSGMQYIKDKYKVPIVINQAIDKVQQTFSEIFKLDSKFKTDGSQFDILVKDADILNAGTLKIEVLHTPGHTPACTCFKIDDAVFTGDLLFMPDVGTGRCDFPKGSAEDLYHSITEKLYTLADDTRVYPGHDYPDNRELLTHTTIRESKNSNVDLPANKNKDEFVTYLQARDKQLSPPKLLYPSVQINMNAGQLPDKQDNNMRYLKIPITGKF